MINSILWNDDETEISFRAEGEENFASIYYTDLKGHINGIETNNNGTTNFGLTNVMNIDPLFCNPDSNDFQLTGNSPCVEYSNDAGPIGAFDIGCDFVGIGDQASVPGEFQLYPAFPNPFNPRTTIRFNFGLGEAIMRPLTLTVYNITGRIVETLVNGNLEPGEHEVVWNGSGFSSGIYFVRLQSNNFVETQKIVLVK